MTEQPVKRQYQFSEQQSERRAVINRARHRAMWLLRHAHWHEYVTLYDKELGDAGVRKHHVGSRKPDPIPPPLRLSNPDQSDGDPSPVSPRDK